MNPTLLLKFGTVIRDCENTCGVLMKATLPPLKKAVDCGTTIACGTTLEKFENPVENPVEKPD
jgi:hypothetical protein